MNHQMSETFFSFLNELILGFLSSQTTRLIKLQSQSTFTKVLVPILIFKICEGCGRCDIGYRCTLTENVSRQTRNSIVNLLAMDWCEWTTRQPLFKLCLQVAGIKPRPLSHHYDLCAGVNELAPYARDIHQQHASSFHRKKLMLLTKWSFLLALI